MNSISIKINNGKIKLTVLAKIDFIYKRRQKEPEASQPPVLVVPRCVVGFALDLEAATAVSVVVSAASATAAQKQDDPDCLATAIAA